MSTYIPNRRSPDGVQYNTEDGDDLNRLWGALPDDPPMSTIVAWWSFAQQAISDAADRMRDMEKEIKELESKRDELRAKLEDE